MDTQMCFLNRSALFLLPLLAGCELFGPIEEDKAGNNNTDTSGDTDVNDGKDNDGDGYKNDADCDDNDGTVYEGADELCDGIDNDCDGEVDEGAAGLDNYYADADADGFGTGAPTEACEPPEGMVSNNEDCDDDNRRVYPGADERCNGTDDDCDGEVDNDATDESTWYVDSDGDSFGDPSKERTGCDQPEGTVANDDDCDDRDDTVNPDAPEICNEVDDDCDGRVDEDAASTMYYSDSDRDGYGDPRGGTESCEQPAGTVENSDDCDDTDGAVNPGADEVCNSIDDNCDGSIDEGASDAAYGYTDADGDGLGDPASYDLMCDGVSNADDCDDADSTEPQVVDESSTATPNGTLLRPWTSIQDGIDSADRCVIVYDGVYEETLDFDGKDISVRGLDGADSTVVDANGAGPVVTFNSGEGAGAELTGFTLLGGSGFEEETTATRSCGSSTTCTDHYTLVCGGGIYVDGSEPTLRNLTVRSNEISVPADTSSGNDYYYYFGFGGGVCVRNARVELVTMSIENNSADDGGGIYVESSAGVWIERTKILGNTAENGGGIMVDGGTVQVTNSLMAWNHASNAGGGVQAIDATVDFTNVTVGECDAPGSGGGGINASGTTDLTLLNTILYGSDAGYGVVIGASASYTGSYNDVYGNTDDDYSGITDPTGTSGNLSVDPKFVAVTNDGNYGNDDWTLAASSTCIDAGNSAVAYNDADGTRNDIGAYGGPGGSW